MKIRNRKRPKDACQHDLAPKSIAQATKETLATDKPSEPQTPQTIVEKHVASIRVLALSGMASGLLVGRRKE